jgi:chromosome partitioning protein
MIVLVLKNEKGGVAKTTTAIALAQYLSLARKLRVLLMETDPQANIAKVFGVYSKAAGRSLYEVFNDDLKLEDIIVNIGPHLDLALTHKSLEKYEYGKQGMFKLREAMRGLRGYDLCIIDCPPQSGPHTDNALAVADYIIIPTSASVLDISGLNDFITVTLPQLAATGANPNAQLMGVLLTFFDPRLVNDREALEELQAHNVPVIDVTISRAEPVRTAFKHGTSIIEYQPKHKVARQYAALGEEICHYLFGK